jgi:hypothetical protein
VYCRPCHDNKKLQARMRAIAIEVARKTAEAEAIAQGAYAREEAALSILDRAAATEAENDRLHDALAFDRVRMLELHARLSALESQLSGRAAPAAPADWKADAVASVHRALRHEMGFALDELRERFGRADGVDRALDAAAFAESNFPGDSHAMRLIFKKAVRIHLRPMIEGALMTREHDNNQWGRSIWIAQIGREYRIAYDLKGDRPAFVKTSTRACFF